MSGTDDLRELLDRLREEAGPAAARASGKPGPAAPAFPSAAARSQNADFPRRFPRDSAESDTRSPHQDHAWRENRETVFFGMMAGLVAALGGLLAGLEYLVVAGTAILCLFSLVMAYALFLHFRPGSGALSPDLQARLDLLARRVDGIASRPAAHLAAPGPHAGADPETERKIEELYTLFRSLSKAVGKKTG